MKKIRINERDYIRLAELRHEIKKLRDSIKSRHKWLSDKEINIVKIAYGDIVRAIYKEEREELLKHKMTPQFIQEFNEMLLNDMPGDFVVYRMKEENNECEYFKEWNKGKPTFSDYDNCMVFYYESKAKGIAEMLNDDYGMERFMVLDVTGDKVK